MNKRIRKKVAKRNAISEMVKDSVESMIRDVAMDFSARIQAASMRGEIDLEQVMINFKIAVARPMMEVCENGEAPCQL